MKAIPEKIFLSYEPAEDYKDHIFIDYMWHIHPFEGRNLKNVEYTRTDAFIEKVAKYLQEHLIDYWSQGVTDESSFIERFKDYMKGE